MALTLTCTCLHCGEKEEFNPAVVAAGTHVHCSRCGGPMAENRRASASPRSRRKPGYNCIYCDAAFYTDARLLCHYREDHVKEMPVRREYYFDYVDAYVRPGKVVRRSYHYSNRVIFGYNDMGDVILGTISASAPPNVWDFFHESVEMLQGPDVPDLTRRRDHVEDDDGELCIYTGFGDLSLLPGPVGDGAVSGPLSA